ncbi:hypothetical protein GCM10009535_32820 [Streptomyces thermocarboxydovorans]|uniref:Tox-REase-2 domain-containing protein n=1 Tax=Streptomyces thermocarboxydovorans TaxID=59298 RepID=A0ABN1HIC9_9ACTN
MIKASVAMVSTVMAGTRDTTIALSHELGRQQGMAGDDDAARAFAKVNTSAASTTLDKTGFSAYVMGGTGTGLMRNAREFTARESQVVPAVLERQADLTAGMGDPGADRSERFPGLGQELPEVVGDTAWYDQYAPGGMSDRFRGSPEKSRDVAGSWRAGGLAGGGGPADPDNACPSRVAGYPEREVPPASRRHALMVDGIRPAHGYLAEAKHVRDPDCATRSFRSIERLDETLAKPVKTDARGNPK